MSDHCRVIITGSVPVKLFSGLADAFSRHYPNAVALNSEHPFSREHGATLVLVPKDDPVLQQTGAPTKRDPETSL